MEENNNQLIIVAAIIHSKNGKLLLCKRSDDVDRSPGKLEPPSGKLEFGEDPLRGVERVAQRNLGLNVIASKLIGSRSFVSERSNTHVVIFYNAAELDDPSIQPSIQSNNGYQNADWYDVSEIQQDTLEKSFKTVFPKIKSHLEKLVAINKNDDQVTTSDTLIVFSDGGSRGNPGPSASGFVIVNEAGEVLEEGGEYLGITTNNQAEYQAVKLGLEHVIKYHPKKVIYKMDSLLVVNQMKGIFKVKNKDLWPIHQEIKRLSEGLNIEFGHVPREQNTLADGKVNEVLDSRNRK